MAVQLVLVLFLDVMILYVLLEDQSFGWKFLWGLLLIPTALFSLAQVRLATQWHRGLRPLRVVDAGVDFDSSLFGAGRNQESIMSIGEVEEFRIRVGGPERGPYSLELVLKTGKRIRTGWRLSEEMEPIARELESRWPAMTKRVG
jgi:hypothetical protein